MRLSSYTVGWFPSALLLAITLPVLPPFAVSTIAQTQRDRPSPLLQVEGVLEEDGPVLPEDGGRYAEHIFEGQAGQTITIVMESLEFDTVLFLFNPDGELIVNNDDYDENNFNSVIKITLPEDGKYAIIANALGAEGKGHYIITVLPGEEPVFSEAILRQVEARQLNRQGIQQDRSGEYQAALESYEQALEIYREIGDRQNEALLLNNLGSIYSNLSDYNSALNKYRQALEIRREIRDFLGESNSLNSIGLVYFSQSDLSQALGFYLQALAIQQDVNHLIGEGITLSNIGAVYEFQGKYSQALTCYQQALEIQENIGDVSGEAITLSNIGGVYSLQGQYLQALEYYQQALEIHQDAEYFNGERVVLSNIGLVYFERGDYLKALEYHQQSLEIARATGNRNGEATSLNNIGTSYTQLGDYSQALERFQKALGIQREISNRHGEATSLGNIGSVYSRLSNYSQALDYSQQALDIRRSIDDRRGEAISLNNIGDVYESLGNYSKSLEYYQESLNISQSIGDRASEANTLGNIGAINISLNDFPKALEYFQNATEIQQDIGSQYYEAISLGNIGFTHIRLSEYPQAIEYFQQALKIQQEIGDRQGVAIALANIGEAHRYLGNYDQSLENHQKALGILQEIGDRSAESITLRNIGRTLAASEQPELAIVFYKQSINITESIRGEIQGLSQGLQQSYTDSIADTYRDLADLLLQQDRVLEAQQVLDLLKIQELDDYLRNVRGNTETRQGVVVLSPEQEIVDRYQELQTSASRLGSEIAQLRQISEPDRTPAQRQQLTQLIALQDELNQQFNTFAQSEDVQQWLDQLSRAAQGQMVDLEDLSALQDDLQAVNAVLLYPLVLDDRLELIITLPDPESVPIRRTVNVERVELNRVIAEFRQALTDPDSDAHAPAQQLYDWLIRPFEAELAQVNGQTLIYSPDGQLRYIPLAALHDGQQWLAQRYQVNNITARSLTDLTRQPQTQPRILAGAFADPTLNHPVILNNSEENFSGLPYAGREVEALVAQANATAFVDLDFSLDAVRPLMNEYNIVHFATHAAFAPGAPEQSFILFGSGEYPTLQEIRNWTLNNIDLVVLSACETGVGGLGSGEEVLGLGYVFQDRGAKAVMASLWSVDDGGTQLLMNAFYDALAQGMTKTEAIQAAQIALMEGDLTASGVPRGATIEVVSARTGLPTAVADNLAHPYYWAPFILIGNGL